MDPAALELEPFFARHFAPVFLVGADPKTIREYRTTLVRWRELTPNPRLTECTVEHLAVFKSKLADLAGRRGPKLSPAATRSIVGWCWS